MTPAHFDELVALATPYLPVATRGPAAIPPRWRFFAVLFWLAQGERQRVVARAVDVAESTFCKFCNPVVEALRRALPAPAWPDKHERKKIGLDFSRLTGGNHAAWRGLCGPLTVVTPLCSHRLVSIKRISRTAMRVAPSSSSPSLIRGSFGTSWGASPGRVATQMPSRSAPGIGRCWMQGTRYPPWRMENLFLGMLALP
ncbi:hypothetical protein I4F81_001798 [Pyropia yezoensis]|uniref:Uncharacterized protein n=1 Tax=Pyropia yezoensis TaxID=2788 RepID=A0ACC3BML9_PYRYE|nr:hypothetical protein I4F81_001798 [Neopyropia yezoensis]